MSRPILFGIALSLTLPCFGQIAIDQADLRSFYEDFNRKEVVVDAFLSANIFRLESMYGTGYGLYLLDEQGTSINRSTTGQDFINPRVTPSLARQLIKRMAPNGQNWTARARITGRIKAEVLYDTKFWFLDVSKVQFLSRSKTVTETFM